MAVRVIKRAELELTGVSTPDVVRYGRSGGRRVRHRLGGGHRPHGEAPLHCHQPRTLVGVQRDRRTRLALRSAEHLPERQMGPLPHRNAHHLDDETRWSAFPSVDSLICNCVSGRRSALLLNRSAAGTDQSAGCESKHNLRIGAARAQAAKQTSGSSVLLCKFHYALRFQRSVKTHNVVGEMQSDGVRSRRELRIKPKLVTEKTGEEVLVVDVVCARVLSRNR